jgi:hypothetical protein
LLRFSSFLAKAAQAARQLAQRRRNSASTARGRRRSRPRCTRPRPGGTSCCSQARATRCGPRSHSPTLSLHSPCRSPEPGRALCTDKEVVLASAEAPCSFCPAEATPAEGTGQAGAGARGARSAVHQRARALVLLVLLVLVCPCPCPWTRTMTDKDKKNKKHKSPHPLVHRASSAASAGGRHVGTGIAKWHHNEASPFAIWRRAHHTRFLLFRCHVV